MAYDPQAGRRRPRPTATDPAPVDALLGTRDHAPTAGADPDDPPPTPAVTPAPADPPSDTVLLNTGLVAAVGGLIAALVLRHLWRRRHDRAAADDE